MKNQFLLICTIAVLTLSFSAHAAEVTEKIQVLKDQDTKLISETTTENKFEGNMWLSFVHAAGNTDSLSLSGDNDILWRINRFESRWKLGAYYFKVFNSNSLTTGTLAKYIFGTYRLDYYFHPRATIYVGGGGYSDDITGIEDAGKAFAGFTYLVIDDAKTKLRVEAGYDFTYENRIAPNPNVSVHSAAGGVEVSHQINEHVSAYDNLQFQQNVMSASDFRLQNEIGLKSKLTKYFSIKASHKLRFDNLPVTGFGKADSITDISFGLIF